MSDPIPRADELLDTSTMRRIRRRRDALPDLATCATLLVLAACIVLASLHSLTAGLVTTLLAVLACVALWGLTGERGAQAVAGLVAQVRAMPRRARRAVAGLDAWTHAMLYRPRHALPQPSRGGGNPSSRLITANTAPIVPAGPAHTSVHSR